VTLAELTETIGSPCVYVVRRARVQPMTRDTFLALAGAIAATDAVVCMTEQGAIEAAQEQAERRCDVCRWDGEHQAWCPESR
jgi:hypothetical protein